MKPYVLCFCYASSLDGPMFVHWYERGNVNEYSIQSHNPKSYVALCLSHTPSINQHLPIEFCCLLIDLLSIIPGLDIIISHNKKKLTKFFSKIKFFPFLLTRFVFFFFQLEKIYILYSIRLQFERTKHTQLIGGTRKLERKNMTVVSVQLRKLFHSN